MKNTKFLLSCLMILCFSMGLFAQSNTYINGRDSFNLVFTTNNVQRMEIFKNGKIQMAPLVDGNKGLATFDSSGNIRPLDFNGNAGTVLTGNGAFTNISSISLWQQSGSNIYFTGGNVGIGTTDPHYPLQIVGNVVDSGNLYATNIATFNSISVGQFKLVAGVVDSIVTTSGALQLSATIVNAAGALTTARAITAGTSDTAITIDGDAGKITCGLKTISFGIDTLATTGKVLAGSMAINTTSVPSGYSLAVNGAVIATDVYVELYSSWPDYVFDKKYKHRSLEELEDYLNINHHLPGLPSAKEVKDKGSISLGDVVTQNTKQIEELTLDLIELNKKVNALEEENKKLIEESKKK